MPESVEATFAGSQAVKISRIGKFKFDNDAVALAVENPDEVITQL